MAELLAGGAQVRMLVRPDEVTHALAVLAAAGVPAQPTATDGTHAGWITVRVNGDQASRCNQVLAAQGIFAGGIDATSDLESVFLSLTAGTGMDVGSAMPSGPAMGWGESEARR